MAQASPEIRFGCSRSFTTSIGQYAVRIIRMQCDLVPSMDFHTQMIGAGSLEVFDDRQSDVSYGAEGQTNYLSQPRR